MMHAAAGKCLSQLQLSGLVAKFIGLVPQFLAGLGDTAESILSISRELIDIGVYPFVVPFVPISGTPLEDHPAPSPEFMKSILAPLGAMLRDAQMRSADIKAGCGKCGACSSLASYED